MPCAKQTIRSLTETDESPGVELLGEFTLPIGDVPGLRADSLATMLTAASGEGETWRVPVAGELSKLRVFDGGIAKLEVELNDYWSDNLPKGFRGAVAVFRADTHRVADIAAFGSKAAVQALIRKVAAKSSFSESQQVEDLGAALVDYDTWMKSPHRRFSIFVKERAKQLMPDAKLYVVSMTTDPATFAKFAWDSRTNTPMRVEEFVQKYINTVEYPAMLLVTTDRQIAVSTVVFGTKAALQKLARSFTKSSAFSESQQPVELLGFVKVSNSWEESEIITYHGFIRDFIDEHFPNFTLSVAPCTVGDDRTVMVWDAFHKTERPLDDYAKHWVTQYDKSAEAAVVLLVERSSDTVVIGPKAEVQALIRKLARADAFESQQDFEHLGTVTYSGDWAARSKWKCSTFRRFIADVAERELPDAQLHVVDRANDRVFVTPQVFDSSAHLMRTPAEYAKVCLKGRANASVQVDGEYTNPAMVFGTKQAVQAFIRKLARSNAFESRLAKELVDRKLEAAQ